MDPNNPASPIAPDNSQSAIQAVANISRTVTEPNGSRTNASTRPKSIITYAPPRSLRTRTSLPSAPVPSKATKNAGPPQDLDKIKAKLGPEGVVARRDEVVKEKEGQLRELVDGHDTAVREIFHLERYVSLLEGWDPLVRPLSLSLPITMNLIARLPSRIIPQSSRT